MSAVLYGFGALAVMAGAATIGFGIPIKEFGIGNTMILAGTTVFSAGLVMVGLAAAVAQLRHLADVFASRSPDREPRPLDAIERTGLVPAGLGLRADQAADPGPDHGADRAPNRIPFPPKPKARTESLAQVPSVQVPVLEPIPPPMLARQTADDRPAADAPPSLQNPVITHRADSSVAATDGDEPHRPPATSAELSGVAAVAPPPSPPPGPGIDAAPADTGAERDDADAAFIRPPQPNYFDTVWPADNRPSQNKLNGDASQRPAALGLAAPEPPSSPMVQAVQAVQAVQDSPPASQADLPQREAPTVLKSGVVDGMAYTLYVDGSIEAELPNGTLYFASINELREHLEKNA
jgi:hypothetical protein